MIPAARRFIAADLAASRSFSRIRERPPVPYYSRQPFSPSAASRSRHQPPHRRLLFLPKTAPFSSSVAFLTPPTFPAPAPRKRFFDPLPKKILRFRTRKAWPAAQQYLSQARAFRLRAGGRGRGRVWCDLRPGRWRWCWRWLPVPLPLVVRCPCLVRWLLSGLPAGGSWLLLLLPLCLLAACTAPGPA
mgnify:CR=1 FL=1